MRRLTPRRPRALSIAALYPPNAFGGAEISAWNLANWLSRQGWDMGVVTAAADPSQVVSNAFEDGTSVWRIRTPHIYPIFKFPEAPRWQKPIWHLQDHFDPRNPAAVLEAVDEFKPDIILNHYIQGLGYNILPKLAERHIPVVYFLHDLGLACIRMSMFKHGETCRRQCVMCICSSAAKARDLSGFNRIGFVSPSRANLETLKRYFPVGDRPQAAIMNANAYPAPTNGRTDAPEVRFLYAGRLHEQKGVSVVLEAAEGLDPERFSMTIVGGGQQEAELHARFAHHPWCSFTGQVSQQEVANAMNAADVLLAPSIWQENSPGVVIQALGMGLPVIGSDIGGIPELVQRGRNGDLAPPGDSVAWGARMQAVIDDRAELERWRLYAAQTRCDFDQDRIGARIIEFLIEVAGEDLARLSAGAASA